jgi:hypothetical protein
MMRVVTHGDPIRPSTTGLIEGSSHHVARRNDWMLLAVLDRARRVRIALRMHITHGDVRRHSMALSIVRSILNRTCEDGAERDGRLHHPHLLSLLVLTVGLLPKSVRATPSPARRLPLL